MYREIKQLLVKNPQKATHESVLELMNRYSEALPDTPSMIPIRCYLNKRKESLRQLENQPHYTKQVLVEIASTILDEKDGQEVDDYISNKQTHIALREYAQESVQKLYVRNIKLTSKNPEDQTVPLPLNNRKRQHMHQFAVSGARIPSELLVKKKTKFNRGGGRGNGRQTQSSRFHQNGQKTQNQPQPKQNGKGGGRGRGRGNRGGRAPAVATKKPTAAATTTTPTDGETCESIFDCYDLSKIPQKVAHFGQITPEMHKMLHLFWNHRSHQL